MTIEVIENLEPYKDLSALNNELKTVKDFMDLLSFDGGLKLVDLEISILYGKK